MIRLRMAWPLLMLAGLVAFGVAAPAFAPFDPLAESGDPLAPPSTDHPFGTDLIGRDVYSRVLHGGGRTLWIGGVALLLAVTPGAVIGLLAGYAGGWPDALIGVLLNALLSIPSLVLALTVVALAGNGPGQVALAVGLAGMPVYAGVTRSAVRAVRGLPFVEAARSIGAGHARILFRHVLPVASGPLIAFATVSLAWAILNAATLNFLGFGGDPSLPEWGAMLADARTFYRAAPWAAAAPGGAIMLLLMAIHLAAHGLEQVRG